MGPGAMQFESDAGIAHEWKDSVGPVTEEKPSSFAPATGKDAADGTPLGGPALPTNREHA